VTRLLHSAVFVVIPARVSGACEESRNQRRRRQKNGILRAAATRENDKQPIPQDKKPSLCYAGLNNLYGHAKVICFCLSLSFLKRGQRPQFAVGLDAENEGSPVFGNVRHHSWHGKIKQFDDHIPGKPLRPHNERSHPGIDDCVTLSWIRLDIPIFCDQNPSPSSDVREPVHVMSVLRKVVRKYFGGTTASRAYCSGYRLSR